MQAWQCDDDGWLLGPTDVMMSPLEPGVPLLPRNATLTMPPTEPGPDGTNLRMVNGAWVHQYRQPGGL